MTFRQLLVPLTPLYRLGLAFRELRLRRGWEPVQNLSFSVISIGNLSTGGAGKTPFAIALAKALIARGCTVDVLSRGYRRQSSAPARVRPDGTAEAFGDEPLLIAREAGVSVYVARQRYKAGLLAEADAATDLDGRAFIHGRTSLKKAAVILSGGRGAAEAEGPAAKNRAESQPAPGIHILDDAFQHRQLHRDVDILLLNREDWRDRLLPAGNLREPLHAAQRATVIAIPMNDPGLERELRDRGWQGPVWRLHRHMQVPAVDGPAIAFCGVARPEQFFAGLEAAGLRLAARLTFRDHHRYTASDLDRLQAVAHTAGANALITTAKDKVRLEPLIRSLESSLQLLTAGLLIEIEDEPGAMNWLIGRLSGIPARLSL